MSDHNHDEEIIKTIRGNTQTGQVLQNKVGKSLADAVATAVLDCDITGLSRAEADYKLKAAIVDAVDKFNGK